MMRADRAVLLSRRSHGVACGQEPAAVFATAATLTVVTVAAAWFAGLSEEDGVKSGGAYSIELNGQSRSSHATTAL